MADAANRSTMRVPQPDIIEHFGNADAVPQLPERCLSRKAGIMRYCPKYQMARLQMQCGPLFLVLLYILYVIGEFCLTQTDAGIIINAV